MSWKRYLLPILLFFLIFLIYIHNLSRSVYGGDVGDLVSAASLGGVPHAPGYPLFTFLGFSLIHLFPNFTPAFSVGIISAYSGALGVLFFFLLCKYVTKSSLIALISSLILAFSYPYWFYSEIAEVFALNNMFIILLFYLALRYFYERKLYLFFLFSFFFGLSLGNHQTVVLILPGIAALFIKKYTLSIFKKNVLFLCLSLLFFFFGFLIYLYVPFASSYHPAINWDTVHDIPSFFHLLLRQDYGTFTAGTFTQPQPIQRFLVLKTYSWYVLTQLTIPVVAIIFCGIIFLWKKNKRILLAFLLPFLLAGPVFIGYAGFPLFESFFIGVYERFFIASCIIALFFFPFGMLALSSLFKNFYKKRISVVLLQVIFCIIPLLLVIYNYPKTNLSTVFIGDNLGSDILSPLPPHAVVFIAGDTVLFNTWYMHYALRMRTDVEIINLNGAIQNDYFNQIRLQVKKSHTHMKTEDLIIAILKEIAKNRPVFSIQQLEPTNGKKVTWIPYGMVFALQNDTNIPLESDFIKQNNHIWATLHTPDLKKKTKALGSLTISEIPSIYANQILVIGNFFLTQYADAKEAKYWYDKALAVDPDYAKTHEVLGVYHLTITKECTLASQDFSKTLELDPSEKMSYFLLYTTERDCLKDTRSANRVANKFSTSFQQNFTNEFRKILK